MADHSLKQSGIYAIRNTVTGRVYVGSAIHLWRRWRGHRHHLKHGTHHAAILQRSWAKHGEDAFTFEVLEFVPDKADLLVREQHWMDALGAAKRKTGMNSRPNASNNLGFKMSAKSRAQLSASQRGKPRSPEYRAKIAAGVTAHFAESTPEERRLWSEKMKRASAHLIGKDTPPETLAKISVGCKAAWAKNKDARLAGKRPDNRSMTYAEAEQIRDLKAYGWTYDQLVEAYGLDRASLFRLVHRETYRAP